MLLDEKGETTWGVLASASGQSPRTVGRRVNNGAGQPVTSPLVRRRAGELTGIGSRSQLDQVLPGDPATAEPH